ncbi:aldehyde dehydrogenase family protein [Gracilibacillus salitolerans]|uniref:3-sulfolactaldehyde dehydrogenase n=1 Tax=Gracilibacillus salitolerans TaxID=2663022 RepID=A0A5Q2TPR2_9BACI|nr:aldehyde dehydrogenase family protein [Gracilibacillus salitolerans]QGH36112.1 aldehyde dehydrogenase family protein [Gracilibacillus salitolerans]
MNNGEKMLQFLENHQPHSYGNYINGQWVNSVSDKTYTIYNAANHKQALAHFPKSTPEDVEQAVLAAKDAFETWSVLPGPERGAILYKVADLLEENIEELAFIVSAEQGKVFKESMGEVLRAAKETRFCAGEAFRIEGKTLPAERKNVWNSTARKPIGVIAEIAPWNFPMVTPIRKIAPALAYGCTVVYKPATATPWTSARIMELLTEGGVPDGVVNLIVGSGSTVGDSLVAHPDVKGISFTGSTDLGLRINEIASKRFAKTQLELGGKNPAVVLDYANVNQVANQIISAACTCSGQRCTSISRVIVLRDKKEELVKALINELEKIKIGPAWDDDANMGPLVNKGHLDSVQNYIEIGVQEGANLLYGGELLDDDQYNHGAYMKPALLDHVKPSMRIAKEEIFGPVITITEVASIEEALSVANDVEYGLAASVFTSDLSVAHQCAEKIEAGMVHINHGTASAAHLPFGGTKSSGFGAFSIGSSNIEFFTELKTVYVEY